MIKKIVFLGGEDVSARIEISKKIILKGYDVSIIGTQSEDIFKREGIEYTKYSLNRELNLFNDIRTTFELRKILKTYTTSVIVHAFDTKPTFILPLAAFGLEKIFVTRTITGIGRIFTEKSSKNTLLKFIYEIIQKIISRNVKHTIFQNDDDSKYFLDAKLVKHTNSSVIKSSGIDLKKYNKESVDNNSQLINDLHINVNELTCIMVSRMVRQKGVLNYLEAAELCIQNGYNVNFLLVGQLDTKKDSIALEDILKYKKYVNYLGKRSDIKELLSISNVFVLPTFYREGVPRVLLEASAMGLALIATDMPGCKDVVQNEVNGLLVNIKDSEDLYKKIVLIYQDKEKLETYYKNSKEHVKKFDLNIVIQKYLEVFNKINL
jgi:glycosyltransferase involved in cell wall biosynthesis